MFVLIGTFAIGYAIGKVFGWLGVCLFILAISFID